jgi:SAM-dependent methyltransferase
MKQLPKHLGGHENRTHTDRSTLEYLKNTFNIKTMYDIGCGPGGMLSLAKQMNIDAIGIDGDFTLRHPKELQIVLHDFTVGPLECETKDLSWSCEFLEHVEEKFMDNYFSVFEKTKIVCCTFCNVPGKGHHHVNVQNQEYWDKKFLQRGFIKSVEHTNKIRLISSMDRDFIRNTGTIYLQNV